MVFPSEEVIKSNVPGLYLRKYGNFILPCAQEWDPAAASVLLFVVADVTGL